MDDVERLMASIEATRQQLKATQRVVRTSLQFVADLQEQLEAIQLVPSHSQEAQRYDSVGHATQNGTVSYEVSDLSSRLG